MDFAPADVPEAPRDRLTAIGLALCLGPLTALLVMKLTAEIPWATCLKIAAGEASFPFQYRVLSPLALASWLRVSPLGLAGAEFTFYAAAYVLTYLLAYAIYRGAFPRSVAALAVLVLFVGLAASAAQNVSLKPLAASRMNFGVRHPYDATQLLVVLGMAYAIRARRAVVWYALLAMGTVNRETTIILVPALFLAWRRDGTRVAIAHALVSVGIWLAIKAGLTAAFPGGTWAATPGPFFSVQWPAHAINTAMVLGGLWIFVARGWPAVPADWKGLLAAVPVLVLAMAYAGNLWEIRVYNEALPLLAPVVAAGILGTATRPPT
jgi:hypothetical protein